MHMRSRKDLNSAELETVRVSRNPTTVLTANGEVPTNEEATVYVHDLELFLTVQILEDTPAVPSLGKLCEDKVRAIQGHSGGTQLIYLCRTMWYHSGPSHDCNSIIRSGLIAGGKEPKGGRQTVFFHGSGSHERTTRKRTLPREHENEGQVQHEGGTGKPVAEEVTIEPKINFTIQSISRAEGEQEEEKSRKQCIERLQDIMRHPNKDALIAEL